MGARTRGAQARSGLEPASRCPAGGRERAAGYLGADHVELAVVLQLELDGLLPEGLAQRHHHHGGGGNRQPGSSWKESGGLGRGRGALDRRGRRPEGEERAGRTLERLLGSLAASATTSRPPSVRMRTGLTLTCAPPPAQHKAERVPAGP